jgi:hypothetical protein
VQINYDGVKRRVPRYLLMALSFAPRNCLPFLVAAMGAHEHLLIFSADVRHGGIIQFGGRVSDQMGWCTVESFTRLATDKFTIAAMWTLVSLKTAQAYGESIE